MKHRLARGFTLVSAIFLIVVIALIAGFLVNIGSIQRTTSAFSLMGARAEFAARSGIEWGVHEVLANAVTPVCFASPTSFVIDAAFTVTLDCVATPVTEGATSYVVFDINATAVSVATGGDEPSVA